MYFDKNPKYVFDNRLFQNVTPTDIRMNIKSKNFLELAEGDIIYQVGDYSDSMYLLVKGQVKIKVYGSAGGSSLLKKNDNDFFGEKELLEKIPRKSIAMAVENSLVYALSTKEIKDLKKNKIIRNNLFNPSSTNANSFNSDSDDFEATSQLDSSEYENSETIPEKLDDYDSSDDDLSWNTSNIDEIKDISFDEEPLDDEEAELDYKDDFARQVQSNKHETSFDTNENRSSISDKKDSIIENIKKELTENFPEEVSSDETKAVSQKDSTQNLENKTQELTKKITETIYNEINAPIELIKNYAELLIQKSSSIRANTVLQKIIEQSNLIRASLETHTALFNEKLEIKSQILHASNVLNDVLLLLAGYTEFRNIKLFRRFDADAFIMVDKNLFYQACLQIVKLLCEDISEEGSIFVTVNRTKDIISIEFKSSGNKIPDEQLQKVFEPFAIKSRMGLGLAKKIISEHNGNITAENSNDEGVQITVFLPIVN